MGKEMIMCLFGFHKWIYQENYMDGMGPRQRYCKCCGKFQWKEMPNWSWQQL